MSDFTNYIVYDDMTGRIKRTGHTTAATDIAAQAWDAGEIAMTVSDDARGMDASHYIVSGVLTERPMPSIDLTTVLADGATPITLSNLANPSQVMVDGAANTITGGSTTIAFDIAGTYTVSVPETFPNLPFSASVIAT